MFAFGFCDLASGTVYLCRDRWGIKPLVWKVDDRGLYWASEAKALAPATRDAEGGFAVWSARLSLDIGAEVRKVCYRPASSYPSYRGLPRSVSEATLAPSGGHSVFFRRQTSASGVVYGVKQAGITLHAGFRTEMGKPDIDRILSIT